MERKHGIEAGSASAYHPKRRMATHRRAYARVRGGRRRYGREVPGTLITSVMSGDIENY